MSTGCQGFSRKLKTSRKDPRSPANACAGEAAQKDGAPRFFLDFPALPGWANLCRAYGASVASWSRIYELTVCSDLKIQKE
jgi:hypothetical protein